MKKMNLKIVTPKEIKLEHTGMVAITESEATQLNGGSEFSETVFWALGKVARGLYEFSQGAYNSRHLFYK